MDQEAREERFWELLHWWEGCSHDWGSLEHMEELDGIRQSLPKEDQKFWCLFGDVCPEIRRISSLVLQIDDGSFWRCVELLDELIRYWQTSLDGHCEAAERLPERPDWPGATPLSWHRAMESNVAFLPESPEPDEPDQQFIETAADTDPFLGGSREDFREWCVAIEHIVAKWPWMGKYICREPGYFVIFWSQSHFSRARRIFEKLRSLGHIVALRDACAGGDWDESTPFL